MVKYTKERQNEKYGKLMKECRVFWAFSNAQFEEGAKENPLEEGEKYVSIGGGGYLPKRHIEAFIQGNRDIEKWAKESKKNDKEVILYELNNYECFYTGDIGEALERLNGLGYTKKQVQKMYDKNKNELVASI